MILFFLIRLEKTVRVFVFSSFSTFNKQLTKGCIDLSFVVQLKMYENPNININISCQLSFDAPFLAMSRCAVGCHPFVLWHTIRRISHFLHYLLDKDFVLALSIGCYFYLSLFLSCFPSFSLLGTHLIGDSAVHEIFTAATPRVWLI